MIKIHISYEEPEEVQELQEAINSSMRVIRTKKKRDGKFLRLYIHGTRNERTGGEQVERG